MRFYAAESSRGHASSMGFCNDTIVTVWATRKARDEYVATSRNLSCESIRRDQATRMATNDYDGPRPFSSEKWCVMGDLPVKLMDTDCIGYLDACDPNDMYVIDTFYH
ncbi:MAG: hypothetical protein GY799_25320 [Desulfobulbaceae bacterium]|nr:hypothetical protein [Desulfobulbaceae bacterium]